VAAGVGAPGAVAAPAATIAATTIAAAIDNHPMPRLPKTPPPPRFYAARSYVAGDSVGYLLNRVVVSMRREIEQRMAAHGLTAAQWYPLWRLKIGRPGSARELARDLGIDAGAMTRLIDRLVAKGLVERRRDAADRRVVQLALTPAGRRIAARLPATLADVNNAYLRGFDAAEWQQLQTLLRRMIHNGARDRPEPPARRLAAGAES
jgi:DNA-binding MarR family transcriptional regulator